ncbi:hypothetical protein H310_08199 [Aphanomyces invadans]|uniref:Uncharacterized protein n=1 Tax=Aphanomyces invadans TaxID=157072 RepID=A0A024U0W8_9STRA|nr:hypothetical protein H310_08199 [Aphanomyces invadans]ETV99536.1 hypothetical protein H310_08199 [Aphanomyces invadans]|eukprot:XP_008872092.1 hypothetical protein H310_08199 [Aphanomyces invadans]
MRWIRHVSRLYMQRGRCQSSRVRREGLKSLSTWIAVPGTLRPRLRSRQHRSLLQQQDGLAPIESSRISLSASGRTTLLTTAWRQARKPTDRRQLPWRGQNLEMRGWTPSWTEKPIKIHIATLF